MTTEDLLRTALTIDDELDDIRRAHVWARLEPRLAIAAPRTRARWPVAVGIGLVAAAAAIAVVVRTSPPASFVAPADTTLSLHVDDATRAVLVGPAELEPVSHAPQLTVVRLRRGTLLAEFEGGHGRALRILAPGAVVEIVGTLFSVEARDDASCVSVAHGTVKMTTAARVQFVTTGQRACSDEPAPRPIAPAMRDALAHHEASAIAAAPRPIVTPIVTPIETPEPPVVEHAPAPMPRASEHVVVEAPIRAVAASELAPVAPVMPPPPPPPPPPSPLPSTTPTPTKPTPTLTPTLTPTKPTLNADELYAAAERALAARDPAAADRDLGKLVAEFPSSSLVDQAYYERARIAFDRGDWPAALQAIDLLARIPASPLAEPGAYLRCRVAVASHDSAAADCLTDYRARYPRSPHDGEALGAIIELAFRAGGCARAKPHVDELVARYPTSQAAASWSARCR
ncbi:MAG TPA: outer membrane protein assembly factor BamD [Kofleriaceae bacterium]|jgi:TolA-binding protein